MLFENLDEKKSQQANYLLDCVAFSRLKSDCVLGVERAWGGYV